METFRFYSIILLICLVSPSCNDDAPPMQKPNYDELELSYSDGWSTNFSFITDSNKVYLATIDGEFLCYGILKPEIFDAINTASLKMVLQKSYDADDVECSDCPTVALRLVAWGDTIRITQRGDRASFLDSLVFRIQAFLDDTTHHWIPAQLNLETRNVIIPPAPSIIKKIIFTEISED